jgi:hypothetical protein
MSIDLEACDNMNRKRSILNRKAEPTTGRLGRRRVWAILLLIAFSICLSKDYSVAYSQYKTQHYKQYTFIELNDLDQYYCIEQLWHKESRWSPTAKNAKSSAYGIPQILNLKEQNPFRQIDRGLRYIEHRHQTPCQALAFHNLKGYY